MLNAKVGKIVDQDFTRHAVPEKRIQLLTDRVRPGPLESLLTVKRWLSVFFFILQCRVVCTEFTKYVLLPYRQRQAVLLLRLAMLYLCGEGAQSRLDSLLVPAWQCRRGFSLRTFDPCQDRREIL